MGYSLNHIVNFGSPFQVVHEQIVDVAPNSSHTVVNQVRKFLFVLYGECRHRIEGWHGPSSDVHLRPGDIIALPSLCVQRYSGVEPENGCRLHVVRLSFDPELLPPLPVGRVAEAPVPNDDSSVAEWAEFALRETRCLRNASSNVVTETLFQLRAEAEKREPGHRLRIRSLCVGLTILAARASHAARVVEAVAGPQASHSMYHVGKIKSYLRSRLRHQTRLAEVAHIVGLSEEHVARLFKSVTGLTVFEYVRRLRIAEAKSRLAATDENLSEIARHTGFASLTVFSRNFTRETGMSPSEYRRQIAHQIG